MICTFTSVLLCELSPVPLQQQVAGQTGFPFDRSLNSADIGPAVMEKGDVREDSVPVPLVLNQGICAADWYVSDVGDVPAHSRRSGKVPMQ